MKRNAIFIATIMVVLGIFPVGQVSAMAPDYGDIGR
jgi:hypothetical protein